MTLRSLRLHHALIILIAVALGYWGARQATIPLDFWLWLTVLLAALGGGLWLTGYLLEQAYYGRFGDLVAVATSRLIRVPAVLVIALIVVAIGVSSDIDWLVLIPLGGVVWLTWKVSERQVGREMEAEGKEGVVEFYRPWGYFKMSPAEQDAALEEGLRVIREMDGSGTLSPDPRSDAEMKEWIKGVWDASWGGEERRAEERADEESDL